MTGRHLSKYMNLKTLSVLAAVSLTYAQPTFAQTKKGAPIVYAGQGGTHSAPVHRSAPSSHYQANPSNTNSELRTKRIDFQYPAGAPSKGQGGSSPKIKQVAAVVSPTPSSVGIKSPVLNQPDYNAPTIEEKVLDDVAASSEHQTGLASWYGEAFHGTPTANGELFDMNELTAAHPTFPLPSVAKVTNIDNGKEVTVRINDRGPFVEDRIIDLSKFAAQELGFVDAEAANVRVEYLGPAQSVETSELGQGGVDEVDVDHAETEELSEGEADLDSPLMDPIPNPDVFIQAGSFSDISNAERLSRELSGSSLSVDVVHANVHGSDFFRVLVGPYADRPAADAMRNQLEARGIVKGIVVTAPH